MKITKKILRFAGAFLLIAGMSSNLFASGSGEQTTESASGGDVTIKWMHHFGEESARQWIEEITRIYTEETGVKIEVQAVGYDDYQTLLKAKIASGDAPDIFDLSVSDLPMFTKNNYIADVGECEFWGNLVDSAKVNTAVDGVNYYIPFEAGASAAFYNKDVFEDLGITEMPQTYDEFIAMLEEIQAAGIYPISFGSQEWWTFINDYKASELQHNLRGNADWMADLESRENRFVDDKVFLETLRTFKERHNYGNPDQFGTDWNKATEMVATGKAAMTINGNWAIGAIKEKNPDARIGAFAVPATNDPSQTMITSWLSGGFVVYEESTVKDEVYEFLKVLTSKESGQIWQDAGRLSSVKDLAPALEPALTDISSYLSAGMAFDVSSMRVDFSQEFLNAEVDVFTEFLLDQITDPVEAAELLDKKFDEIAERHKS